MEGKTIKSTLDMGQGYTLLGFEDGTAALVHVIEPELAMDELKEFIGEDAPVKKGKEEKPAKKEEKPAKKEEKSDKKDKGGKAKKEEPKEESLDWAGLVAMDYDELKGLCSENDLSTDPTDFDEDEDDEVEDFRKAIAKECDIEVEDETKDDDYTWDDLKAMDFDELKDVVEEDDLSTDVDDFDESEEGDEDKLRRAIAKELGIEAPAKKKK